MFSFVDCDYELNTDLLKISLNDYLICKDSFSRFKYDHIHRSTKMYFGLSYYDILIENFVIAEGWIDYKPFHILYDHKVAMSLRLEYLFKRKLICINQYNDIVTWCYQLITASLLLRNLVIKYNISKDKNILNIITQKCFELQSQDRDFCSKLFGLIK